MKNNEIYINQKIDLLEKQKKERKNNRLPDIFLKRLLAYSLIGIGHLILLIANIANNQEIDSNIHDVIRYFTFALIFEISWSISLFWIRGIINIKLLYYYLLYIKITSNETKIIN